MDAQVARHAARAASGRVRQPALPAEAASSAAVPRQVFSPQTSLTPCLLEALPSEAALAARSVGELAAKCAQPCALPGLRPGLAKHNFPVSEAALEKVAQAQRARGLTAKEAQNMFDREVERMARPPPGDEFPERVVYEGCCGAQCRETGETARVLRKFGQRFVFR